MGLTDSWDLIAETLFDQNSLGDMYYKEVVGLLLTLETPTLDQFLEKVAEGVFFQYVESHVIELPKLRLEEEGDGNEVCIAVDRFDDVERVEYIDAKRFYSIAQVLLFWAHLNNLTSLCPWEYSDRFRFVLRDANVVP